jgi:hypothetical protein
MAMKRGASLHQLPGVIDEHPGPFKAKKRTINGGLNLSKIESRNSISYNKNQLGLASMDNGTQLKDKLIKAPNTHNRVYTQVFNTYLTPNSMSYLKNKKSLAILDKDGYDSTMPKYKSHRRQ